MKKMLKILIIWILSFMVIFTVNAADETTSSTQTTSAQKETITETHNYGEPLPGEGNAVLKDGYLYYSKSKNEEPKKVEGVANIKSLYIYNIGTGINKVPFVVTNDGIVYRLNSEEKLVKYEELANYKVDKIISHEGEIYDVFTLLLLDGTTKVVIVERDESVDLITTDKTYGEPLPYEGKAVLKDGYLYYSRSENEELKKVEGVSNIKSLYIFNLGTGINRVPFVVTNDGIVYRLNDEEKLVRYDGLSNYKVSEIISHESDEAWDSFKILLLDGTQKNVEVKFIPTISDEEKKENTETKVTTDESKKTTTENEKKDDTVSPVKMPKTGANIIVITTSSLFITAVAIIMYKKYNMYKGIV